MKTLKEIQDILVKYKDEIKKEFRAEIIGVFGSYSMKEQQKKSDVDILVRFLDRATLFDLVGLGEFIEEKLKIKADIVSERAIRPELRERILSEVIAI